MCFETGAGKSEAMKSEAIKSEANEGEHIIPLPELKPITYVERSGKTFAIIEHYTGTQSFTDIIKNALRREVEDFTQV